jgi:spore maturation protein CgeB
MRFSDFHRYALLRASVEKRNSGQISEMDKLTILYVGVDAGTSRHRAHALRRFGHNVCVVDPKGFLPRHRILQYWIHQTGSLFLSAYVRQQVLTAIGSRNFDLALVDAGVLVDRTLVRQLKQRCGVVINYNVDDPFGGRDARKWRLYLEALPVYDLAVVVRECNVREAENAGARGVKWVYRSADEVAHAPRMLTKEDWGRWESRVVFIGTWMPERGRFFARLIKSGVPLAIFGDRWQKAPEWHLLRPHWRGPGLYNDDDYAKAVQCAGVCLGLLSKGNRDLSTQRSFEIPHLGGVLCAERTTEHLNLYREDVEAVFWTSPEDCADKCLKLLSDAGKRKRLASNGRARCLENRTTNESILEEVLSVALKLSTGARTASA